MRKDLLIIGISLILLGLLAIKFGATAQALLTRQRERIDVPALNTITLTYHLSPKDKVRGYFTVRGGNDDIRFSIKDPFGKTIYGSRMTRGRGEFTITATQEGVYTLYFDNSFSWVTEKVVFLTIMRVITVAGFEVFSLIGIIIIIIPTLSR